MKTSQKTHPAVIIGQIFNYCMIIAGAFAVVYGIALAIVKYHAFGF